MKKRQSIDLISLKRKGSNFLTNKSAKGNELEQNTPHLIRNKLKLMMQETPLSL